MAFVGCVRLRERKGKSLNTHGGFFGWLLRKIHVNASVCPTFGCVRAGVNGGHPYVSGGVGLAVADPGIGLSRSSKSKKGSSNHNEIFGGFILGQTWKWKGQDMTRGKVSTGLGASKGGWGSQFGIGYVHMWSYQW
jgi:hypothetical protein